MNAAAAVAAQATRYFDFMMRFVFGVLCDEARGNAGHSRGLEEETDGGARLDKRVVAAFCVRAALHAQRHVDDGEGPVQSGR